MYKFQESFNFFLDLQIAPCGTAYFFVRINRVQEEEGLGGVDHFGGLAARAIYDVEDSVTISMPSHCINHCRIAQDA